MPAILLSITACFMIFIFAPLEIYLGNQREFWYDSYTLFPFLIKDFLFFVAVSIVVHIIAYFLGEFLYTAALYCYFTCFIACYIQGNYLVNSLPPFDGTQIDWNLYRSENIKCIIIWLIIAIILLALVIIIKAKKFQKLVSFVSVFFFLMLGSTLTVVGINGGLLEQKQYSRFIKSNQFEMSKDTNFIILLLDAIDEESFWQVWEQHPEYEEAMADFTFYNNAMSGYAYTAHSLPLIVSGEWFENDEPYEDYYLRIYRDSSFFNRLEEHGYSLSIYDDSLQFKLGTMDDEFANMIYTKSTLSDEKLFNTRIIKMTGIKYAPYFLKPYCWFDPAKLNYQNMGATDEELFVWTNDAFYKDVQNNEITYVDGKRFKLIHLMGAHVPFYYDQYVNEVDDADYYTCIESSMTVTIAYLNKLREAGVYDNSIILVLSDHGYNTSDGAAKIAHIDEDQNGRQHPILFIKGLNESHEMNISGAPISYADLVEAYYKLMDGQLSDNCFDYREGDYRERRYLLYKYLDEDHMVEYMQTGYAGDEDTLIPTGRVFNAK